jgi:hypothetical protein
VPVALTVNAAVLFAPEAQRLAGDAVTFERTIPDEEL